MNLCQAATSAIPDRRGVGSLSSLPWAIRRPAILAPAGGFPSRTLGVRRDSDPRRPRIMPSWRGSNEPRSRFIGRQPGTPLVMPGIGRTGVRMAGTILMTRLRHALDNPPLQERRTANPTTQAGGIGHGYRSPAARL
jgi:hypothetical protein